MADRKFLDFLDRFDGGGAGQMGDKFEGGGLYSVLGNLVASPYGSQDEERKAARMAAYGSDNIGGPPMQTPTPVGTVGGGAPQYSGRGTVGMPSPDYTTSGMTPVTAYQPPQYSGRGTVGMPSPEPQYGGRGTAGMPSQNYATSGMNPATAYVDPRQRFAQDLVDMYGPEMADMVMNGGMVEDTYRGYVDRGYRF